MEKDSLAHISAFKGSNMLTRYLRNYTLVINHTNNYCYEQVASRKQDKPQTDAINLPTGPGQGSADRPASANFLLYSIGITINIQNHLTLTKPNRHESDAGFQEVRATR
jgi:hypothetical protein